MSEFKLLIGGKLVSGAGTLDVINPATDDVLAVAPHADQSQQAAPLAQIVQPEIAPGIAAERDEELSAFCRMSTFTNYHPVGSCRLGKDGDRMAVVDTQLRVRGVSGLRVCDASVMPGIPSANTNAPSMAIADKCVDLWIADARASLS